ncbi:methylenetetrahydrofolate reductase [Marinobacterium weihaiense]|uniref:Methylenetetrahydrofolate reductase n=1 Tax=Marinobacterium weihaiense TaxID=2851016 RepID=A0ABS6M9L0_9GAMM|nr:methylenetetrahydrofolate reductase [Marinobacterium weihaiense]MBV0932978.1 methylenetetrahydrofolate reductase [Marinobacterium weihaiense]
MSESLQQKFADPHRSVCFVGTTPPKASTDDMQMQEIADRLLARLDTLEYDGLIVYDIQDESSRIDTPRPFPYMETRDPREYSKLLTASSQRPIITYKSVAQRDRTDFEQWLSEAWDDYGIRNLVLVGSPSSEGEIKLSLNDAYGALQSHDKPFHLGGVTIAERHAVKGNEHQRLISKVESGCEFFVSQAVYNSQATIDLLTSYARSCREQSIVPKRVILTFTPCGSAKTLEFMQWLGISVPEATRYRILDAETPLAESVRICQNNLEQILDACLPLGLPIGLNIESLTNRKAEIDASIQLYQLLKATLDLRLAERRLNQAG